MAKTLARQLAEAFGDVEAMRALYADNIIWSLQASLGRIAGPYEGKEAVMALSPSATVSTALSIMTPRSDRAQSNGRHGRQRSHTESLRDSASTAAAIATAPSHAPAHSR